MNATGGGLVHLSTSKHKARKAQLLTAGPHPRAAMWETPGPAGQTGLFASWLQFGSYPQMFAFKKLSRIPSPTAIRNPPRGQHQGQQTREAIFEVLFASHGWKSSWRNGMYDFNHFHTHTHEVLGIARGKVTALFGGMKGHKVELKAGDVVVIPSGTGHKRIRQSKDLLIVGAYPTNGGDYDEPKPDRVDLKEARRQIKKVRLPLADPVYGKQGPLRRIWR